MIHEIAAAHEKLLQLGEIIFAKSEEDFDRRVARDEKLSEQIDQPVLCDRGFGAFRGGARCDFEEGDELFELIKDEQRIAFDLRTADFLPKLFAGQNETRRIGGGEIRKQKRRHAAFAHGDAIDHDLRAGLGLHADALRQEPIGDGLGNEARIQEGRFSRTGVSVKQDAAEHRHQPKQPLRLRHASEKNGLIDKTKWSDAAERLGRGFALRNENWRRLRGFGEARVHTGISFPFTCR